jgi:hypothetical protein
MPPIFCAGAMTMRRRTVLRSIFRLAAPLGGAVAFRYEISKDGKTLTRTSRRFEPAGNPDTYVEVFKKQ